MLAAEFDVVDLLDRLAGHSVSLLGAHEAGVVLTDDTGTLRVVAATSEQARFLELFQLQRRSGPCLECVQRGEPIAAPDLAAHADGWPDFAGYAQREGYRSVHATPLNTPTATIGALNIFSKHPLRLEPTDREHDERWRQSYSNARSSGSVVPSALGLITA
jgi:GAF domain-containing protein